MKILILVAVIFSFSLNPCFSQKDKEKIIANFDYIEYYPDSTIKEARKFNGTHLQGTTIEFNTAGEPVAIGRYKKGIKTGKWIYSSGTYSFFVLQKESPERIISLTENYDQYGDKIGAIRIKCVKSLESVVLEFYQGYDTLVNPKSVMPRICWSQYPNR